MKCPTCEAESQRSTVTKIGGASTLLHAPQLFFDEDGKQHHHDRNVTTAEYRCSRGHRFTIKSGKRCWCGWTVNGVLAVTPPERKTAPDLRHELSAMLRAAADKFDEWKAAAWREWEPWTEAHHGREQNRIPPEMEGPYIEQALARSWNDTLRRMADNLSADE